MNKKTYHRFDIDNKALEKIKPHLTEQRRKYTGIVKNSRKFINVVVWILRIGLP